MAGVNVNEKNKQDTNVIKFSLGMALGSFLGPSIGGVLAEKWGYQNAFLMLSIGCLVSMLLSIYIIEFKGNVVHGHSHQKIGNTIGLLKDTTFRKVILIGVLVLFGKDIYTAFFPLLGLEFGLSSSIIGVIISINALAGILMRWSLPTLLNKFSRTKIIVWSIFLSGLFMLALPISEQWFILLFISFLLGLGLGIGQPLSISATIQSLPKHRVGEGLGLRLSANRLTQLLSPIIIGGIAEFVSMRGIFCIVGIVLCVGSSKLRGLTEKEE